MENKTFKYLDWNTLMENKTFKYWIAGTKPGTPYMENKTFKYWIA